MDVADRWTSTVVLGDGTSAVVRPITSDDAPTLAAFHARQSAESRYRRYFSPKLELNDAELERFTNVDFVDRVAFVVEERGEMLAWASYERWNNRDDAEVAFMVDDHHQGKGIATLLLEHLAAVARSNGIDRFTAQTLGDNRSMLTVFAKAGWPVHRRFESGVIDVEFPLADTAAFIDSVERREQRADSRAMARLLLPASIAVVGASDTPGTVGQALWTQVAGNSRRRVYPVNPNHATIGGVPAFATIGDIPDEVTLAVIAVPAGELLTTIDQCIERRVRGAVVVTTIDDVTIDVAGMVAHARGSGLRIIGPGSMGIASPLTDIDLQAALAEVRLPPGNVAMSMQSGSLASAVLRLAVNLQMPTSWFVSLGDKSDISANDLLQFWEDDDATTVITLYTESLGNPRKFARIARRASRTRPIVVVRTGSALSGAGTEALYRDTGVIEVQTVAALLDTARVLATQPLMGGRRVAVVTNSRSPGILAGAALGAAGLTIVPAPRPLGWRSSDADYHPAIAAALADDGIDAVLVIHAPPLPAAPDEAVAAIEGACSGAAKPVVAVMLGTGDGPLQSGSRIPAFAFPEPAAAVLGRIAAYSEWLRTEGAETHDPEQLPDRIDVAAAGTIVADHVDDVAVPPETIRDLLATYGVPMALTYEVASDQAAEIADRVGYPVAVKATRRRIGRSVEAGVALDLTDRHDVDEAVAAMHRHLGDDATTVTVQRMVTPGVDIRVRLRDSERFGPVVSVGLGGLQADAIADESSRLAPVSPTGAAAMIADTRAAAVLDDAAQERLADTLTRVAQLASDHPEIAELDLNPVIVSHDGCWVVDATIVLKRRERADPAVRRLE